MSARQSVLAACLLAAALLAVPAFGEVMYGATVGAYNASATAVGVGSLYRIDPDTGTAVRIGPIRVNGKDPVGITGLALHPKTGALFGITAGLSPNIPRSLVTIDPATGDARLVGSLASPGSDIAFDSKGTLFVWLPELGQVASVDTATGAISPRGKPAAETGTGGLSIDAQDHAVVAASGAAGTLDTVDLATGEVVVGPKLVGAPYASAINSLTFSASGKLYAVNSNMGSPASTRLVVIDRVSGKVEMIGALPLDTDGLTFAPSPPTAGADSSYSSFVPVGIGALAFLAALSIVFLVARRGRR